MAEKLAYLFSKCKGARRLNRGYCEGIHTHRQWGEVAAESAIPTSCLEKILAGLDVDKDFTALNAANDNTLKKAGDVDACRM